LAVNVVTLLECIGDPNLFGPFFKGASWSAWRSFLAALFAERGSVDDVAVYRACTGRTAWPKAAFSEAAVIAGRRGGKSRILALIAVYLATMRDYAPYLAPGEVATIAVLAADRSQARVIFRFVVGLLKAVPLMKPMIDGEDTETIRLDNRVAIEIATASFRSARGYSFAAVLCDEVAFWRSDEAAANPDVEILRALRPGLASIPGSVLLIASSPYAKRGELYNAFRKALRQGRREGSGVEGRDGDDEPVDRPGDHRGGLTRAIPKRRGPSTGRNFATTWPTTSAKRRSTRLSVGDAPNCRPRPAKCTAPFATHLAA
jgi:hypothetical protein